MTPGNIEGDKEMRGGKISAVVMFNSHLGTNFSEGERKIRNKFSEINPSNSSIHPNIKIHKISEGLTICNVLRAGNRAIIFSSAPTLKITLPPNNFKIFSNKGEKKLLAMGAGNRGITLIGAPQRYDAIRKGGYQLKIATLLLKLIPPPLL